MQDVSNAGPARLETVEPQTLKTNYLLQELSPEVVSALEAVCQWEVAPEGAIIFDRGDTRTDVYFIVSGSVRVLDHSQSGQEVAFSDIQADQVFGELSAIDHGERSATVYALEETVLAHVSGADFFEFLTQHSEMAHRMMQHFVKTIRGLNSRVVGLSSMTSIQRVYGEILQMAEPDPSGSGHWLINGVPPHSEIAVWAGTTPETVARAIGQLLKSEIAKRRSRTLVIMNRQRLKDMINAA
jgi:CRP-like cAMP-binding protein